MTLAFVVLQEPEKVAPQVAGMALVRTIQLPKAYLLLVDVSPLRAVQFTNHLEGFFSKNMSTCRLDHNLIFTSTAMSDPIKKIMVWAADWFDAAVTVTSL